MSDKGLKYTTDGLPKNWDGKDWQTYKWAMLTMFEEMSLLDLVTGVEKRSDYFTDEELKRYDIKQLKAKRLVGTSVPPRILKQINHVKTAPEMWKALVELYEGSNNAVMQAHMIRRLLKELETMKLKPGGDANLHLCEMFARRTELKDLKYEVQPIQMVNYMLKSLPNQIEYEHLEWSVVNGSDGSVSDPEAVREKIRLAAARQAERDFNARRAGGSSSGAGTGGGTSGNRGKGNHGKTTDQTDQTAGQNSSKTKKSSGCWVCGSAEHVKKNCPDKNTGGQQSRANYAKLVKSNGAQAEDLVVQREGRQDDAVKQSGVVAGMALAVTTEAPAVVGEDANEVNDGSRDWWCFDTGSNVHLTNNKDQFVTMSTGTKSQICGVSSKLESRVEGVGTVCLATVCDGQEVVFFLDDVYYVPEAHHGLLSPGHAAEQGYTITFDSNSFKMTMKDKPVLHARPEHGVWGFYTFKEGHTSQEETEKIIINYANADGVATMKRWHERLGHANEQYLKTMVDRGLVTGMMLTKRQHEDCEACHLGKQKQKRHNKKAEHSFTAPNEMVYADLMFPSKHNATQYTAILVIMDAYSRFLTVHLLKDKEASTVNPLMKSYVLWAERQAGRSVKKIVSRDLMIMEGHTVLPVQQVLTDKGTEFVNNEMEAWYKARGIDHTKVGPKSSHLNPCERQHQSIGESTKALMRQAGFPKSFWPDALVYSVYLKNRLYHKAADATPYEKMFGTKPDLHHIRKFGSLVYSHVPKTPNRHREDDNAKIGFLLGMKEGELGYKVYYPSENTSKWVPDLRVNEDIVYRDRHALQVQDEVDAVSVHFTPDPDVRDSDSEDDEMDDESDDDGVEQLLEQDDGTGITASMRGDDGTYVSILKERARSHRTKSSRAQSVGSEAAQTDDAVNEGGRTQDDEQSQDVSKPKPSVHWPDEESEEQKEDEDDGESFGSDHLSATAADQGSTDQGSEKTMDDEQGSDDGVQVGPYSIHGRAEHKRVERELTPSDQQDQPSEKRPRRTGLRDADMRRPPDRYKDFVAYATGVRMLDDRGKPIRYTDVKIPRSFREAMRSKWAEFWRLAMDEEFAALIRKGVMKEMTASQVPDFAKYLKTMWVWDIKTDYQGYVIRFKARLVVFGNWQRPGFDFAETFAPVARMTSFRMTIGLAAALNLKIYGADINTAYLNADLKIPQYVRGIEGFPCETPGNVYVLEKALYGLRQAGREWNEELNSWMVMNGFLRCGTEPCLYYKLLKDEIILVLVYVDDILCATNNEEAKIELFRQLNDKYGIKDQGLLKDYLGIEITQSETEIAISQSKYTQEILEKYDYASSNKVGNPMETNMTLQQGQDEHEFDHEYDYRGAVGMLMYLATCTRPDIAYVVGQLSRFAAAPTKQHVGTVKRVFRYLIGTKHHGIHYRRDKDGSPHKEIDLLGSCDSDWAKDPDTRKSTTGFVITLAGGAIAWMSRRQSIVALSTAEAEYVAACEATMEATAERNVLEEVLPQFKVNLEIGIDSQSAHVLATDPTYSRRTRHIELRWHFIREQVRRGIVKLHKIPGTDNPADAFTKPLDLVGEASGRQSQSWQLLYEVEVTIRSRTSRSR